MSTYETVYLGHDNIIDMVLTSDGYTVDITATTRATAVFGSTLIDSETSMSVFDWSEGEEGLLHMTFGEESIPVGSYKVVLTLYDVVNSDGIVWDDFRCRVVGEDLSPVPPTDPPILISQGGTGQSTAAAAFDALKQIATETYTGVTELATTAECVTGTDISRVVTPAGLTARMRSPSAIGDVSPAAGNFTVGHFGDDTNYAEFLSDGKLHFAGDSRPVKFAVFPSNCLSSTHHNPLELTEINGIASSITVGASNKIDIIGIDGGVNVKGRLKNTVFSAVDTTSVSAITKIRLSADAPAGWSSASQWRVTLGIVSGSVTGDFTVFLPPFVLESGDRIEGYITDDGAVYMERSMGGFDVSVAGSEYVSQNMSNNESAGSNVVIEIADTTGFYVGNIVNVIDDANSEVSRITAVSAGVSITVDTLTNSYTTAANAKVEIIEYTQTAPVVPTQRGMLRTPLLKTGINSGRVVEYGIPHTIDATEDIGIVLHYITTADNAASQDIRFRVQYMISDMGVYIPDSIQYGTQIYTTWTPPTSKTNNIVSLGAIPAAVHNGKHILSIRVMRDGADAIDTYTGDVRVVALVLTYHVKQLGYEV